MSGFKIFAIALGSLGFGYLISSGFFGTPAGWLIVAAYAIMFISGLIAAWGLLLLITQQLHSHRDEVKAKWGLTGLACFDVMVHMSMADGHLDETEIAVISSISSHLFGRKASDSEIKGAAKEVVNSKRPIEFVLQGLNNRLNSQQKGLIIKAALYLINADGKVTASEQEMLARVVSALNISTNELTDLTAEVVENPWKG